MPSHVFFYCFFFYIFDEVVDDERHGGGERVLEQVKGDPFEHAPHALAAPHVRQRLRRPHLPDRGAIAKRLLPTPHRVQRIN